MPMRMSETGPFLQLLGVPRPLDRDVRGGALDLAEIVRGQPDCRGADVLFQARQFGRARDWYDPRLSGQEPRERDLRRCRLLPIRNVPQDMHDGLIRLPRLRREARNDVAEIRVHKRRFLVDRARQEALAEGTEWHKPDAELLQGRQQLFLRASPPQGILALHGRHRLHCVRAADRAHAGFRHAEVFHLALRNQFLDRSRHVFDRHVRVNAVLIIEIDHIGPEPFQRPFDAPLDAIGPAGLHLLSVLDFDAELGGNHDLSAHGRQRLADELFVGVCTVNLCGIEERDAALDGLADERDHRLLVRWDTVALAHPHATKAEGRNLQVAASEFALLHWSLLQGFTMTLMASRSLSGSYLTVPTGAGSSSASEVDSSR